MVKKSEGITLIALVITIIVLLILAGITLSLVAGENGILKRATNAVDVNEKEIAKEQVSLAIETYQTEYYEKKYVDGEIVLGMEMGKWIYETYGGENQTQDYTFTINSPNTGEPSEDNPYGVTILENNKLNSKVTGTLTTSGKLSWDEETKEIPEEKEMNSKANQELKDLLETGNIEMTLEDVLNSSTMSQKLAENEKIKSEFEIETTEDLSDALLNSGLNLDEILEKAGIDEISIEDISESETLLNKIFTNSNTVDYLEKNKDILEKLTSNEKAKDILKETNKPLYNELSRVDLNLVPSEHNTGTVNYSNGEYTLSGLASLESEEIMNLTTFTMYLEVKDLTCYYNGSSIDTMSGTVGTVFSLGSSASGAENKMLGLSIKGDSQLRAWSGSGGYSAFLDNFSLGNWSKIAMTYDGKTLKLFVNGSEIWKNSSAKVFQTHFYVGGFPDAPYYRSPSYIGVANGSYRNIKVYNMAIDPSEL